jgi:2-keto-4-pentenoate hydratase/2-oxohepta-3-ene-1,7-dioic acid hydratase in catechol pathway
MRLARLGEPGHERPFAVDGQGLGVDLSGVVTDIDPAFLADRGVARVRALLDRLSADRWVPIDHLRCGPPVAGIGKIVGIGLNYRRHAQEMDSPFPDEPPLFLKAPYTVIGPHDTVLIPPTSAKTDYEVELAVVIGTEARYLADPDRALSHVAGYAISNDVSEREFQLERGGQWDKGKNCETFNPLGPWLVTADAIPDPQSLELTSSVNGEVRQSSNTSDMIFPVAHLVWYLSQFMTLLPGDVISTGTPEGVGGGFSPPRFLEPGDEVTMSITHLGTQRQRTARAHA